MDWYTVLLHGGRTGAYDTALDTALLAVPVLLAGAMVAAPRIIGRLRARHQQQEQPPEHRSHHGDEPI